MIVNSVNYSSEVVDYIPITTFAELKAALEGSSQSLRLKLMNDIAATDLLACVSTNTLDLDGHTISGPGTIYVRFCVVTPDGNLTIQDSSSAGTGKITGFAPTSWDGGCINVNGGVLTLESGTIQNCSASRSGGIHVRNSGSFTMNGGTITGCSGGYGGGIGVEDGTCIINNGLITGCSASFGGGLALLDGNTGTVTINGGEITQCTSTRDGGGIHVAYSTGILYIKGGRVTHCTANDSTGSNIDFGGAIDIAYSTVEMSDGEFLYCAADYGGGIHVDGSRGVFTISGGLVVGNTAVYSNGGVYVTRNATYTKTGGIVAGNTPQE